jgi:hypothetical protein
VREIGPSSAATSTTGSRDGSTVGPAGENEHDPASPPSSRITGTSTASATSMSRTVSAERGGFDGGAGS